MSANGSQKVILLVDDDLDDAEIFSQILIDIDPMIQFYHLKHGSELMTHLRHPNHPMPQIIFLDLNMPEMNGWQCLTQLKSDALTRQIPVVIYSTSSQQRDKHQAQLAGAVAFITKPSDYKKLRNLLFKVTTSLDRDVLSALQNL